MSNVELTIGGRHYTVACAAGEETHVSGLARQIDERIVQMGDAAGHSESRSLLFAALLLADELHEAKGLLNEAGPSLDAGTLAPALDEIALRLENLATRLERQGTNA